MFEGDDVSDSNYQYMMDNQFLHGKCEEGTRFQYCGDR